MCTGLTVVVLCSPSPGGSHTSVKQWPKSGAHTASPATSREGGLSSQPHPRSPGDPPGRTHIPACLLAQDTGGFQLIAERGGESEAEWRGRKFWQEEERGPGQRVFPVASAFERVVLSTKN